MPKLRPILVLCVLLLHFGNSPADASRPFIAAESAVPVERGSSRLEVGYEYARISTEDYRQIVLIELTHGLLNNLDFEVEVPTVFAKQLGARDEGLGDLQLKSKIRFLKGREANPLSLSGQLAIKFPTCDDDKDPIRNLDPFCTGEVDVSFRGIASKVFTPVTVHLNLGYTFVGNPPNESRDDVFLYDLAFEYDTPVAGLALVAELVGEINQNIAYSGQDPLALLLGVVYEAIPSLGFNSAFSAGLTEGSPDYTFSVGLAYSF